MSKLLRAVLFSAYCALFLHIYLYITSGPEDIIELKYLFRKPGTLKKVERSIRRGRNHSPMFYYNFTQPKRFPTDLKYILKWTQAFSHYSSPIFKSGQRAFLDYNCSYFNCFLTNDRSILVDLRYYDAILFDVENNWEEHPPIRAPYQRYIFTASESAANYPICENYLDNYYNWTWTYRLDSDIQWTYLTVLDINNNIVGPRINMKWVDPMKPTPVAVKKKIASKTKAVAWFVSNCHVKDRQTVAHNIANSLTKYNLSLDTYGFCGERTCPRDRIEDCLILLQNDYFFYLSFENSRAEDYVTEKILYPLLHYTVPVVYGGADYSRFLPPSSYIDASQLNSDEVAAIIAGAINNRKIYEDYFKWHNHYIYKESPFIADVCTLCEMLNTDRSTRSLKSFRHWWNPDYKKLCKEEKRDDVSI